MTPIFWSTAAEVTTLSLAAEKILRRVQVKWFPAHRAGRVWRFTISEVDEWMRNGSGAVPSTARRTSSRSP